MTTLATNDNQYCWIQQPCPNSSRQGCIHYFSLCRWWRPSSRISYHWYRNIVQPTIKKAMDPHPQHSSFNLPSMPKLVQKKNGVCYLRRRLMISIAMAKDTNNILWHWHLYDSNDWSIGPKQDIAKSNNLGRMRSSQESHPSSLA